MKKETSEVIKMKHECWVCNIMDLSIFKKLWDKFWGINWEKEYDILYTYSQNLEKQTEALLAQKEEGEAFLTHISKHLVENEHVICMICKKTSEVIYKNAKHSE